MLPTEEKITTRKLHHIFLSKFPFDFSNADINIYPDNLLQPQPFVFRKVPLHVFSINLESDGEKGK